MIVSSMDQKEIINEIINDAFAVRRKGVYIADSIRRKVVKSKIRPYNEYFNYTSLRKNKWLILVQYTKVWQFTYVFVHYLNSYGINIIYFQDSDKFMHFSSHYLKRYNERFLNKPTLSVLDIFKEYFLRNGEYSIDDMDHTINLAKITAITNDGVAFGTAENVGRYRVISLHTFINNQMVLEFQKDKIKTLYEHYQYYKSHPVPIVEK